jgi:hypothetical protein
MEAHHWGVQGWKSAVESEVISEIHDNACTRAMLQYTVEFLLLQFARISPREKRNSFWFQVLYKAGQLLIAAVAAKHRHQQSMFEIKEKDDND